MPQLKRDDWLQHGLQTLAESGVDSLTIDGLCRQLGVTKGSFYHHFKNHRAYLEAVLQYWEDEYTSRFIAYSQEGETVAEQLDRLNDLVSKSFGGYEVYIRAWAQTDTLAREFQERVDKRRVEYLYQLYQQWLQDDKQALAMAHLAYTALIGSNNIFPPLKRENFNNMAALLTRLVHSLPKKE